MRVLARALRPIVQLLSFTTDGLLRIGGVSHAPDAGVSEEAGAMHQTNTTDEHAGWTEVARRFRRLDHAREIQTLLGISRPSPPGSRR
jgi:CBS domain containing-hemolysin-like protein